MHYFITCGNNNKSIERVLIKEGDKLRLEELKMLVAENCPGYEPLASVFLSDVGNIIDTCDNCDNYVEEKCIVNLFDPIKRKINRN